MKKFFAPLVIVVLAMFCSCQKHLTDEELQTRIEQEVKRQLAAEREAQQKELDRHRAELTARRNALLDRKGATTNTLVPGVPRPPIRPPIREGSANPATAFPPGTIRRPQLPPGVTLPERPVQGTRLPISRPGESGPSTSETSAAPSVTPAGPEAPAVSPLPETAESASPTPTPAADGTAQ